jgi:hypothetical protein
VKCGISNALCGTEDDAEFEKSESLDSKNFNDECDSADDCTDILQCICELAL